MTMSLKTKLVVLLLFAILLSTLAMAIASLYKLTAVKEEERERRLSAALRVSQAAYRDEGEKALAYAGGLASETFIQELLIRKDRQALVDILVPMTKKIGASAVNIFDKEGTIFVRGNLPERTGEKSQRWVIQEALAGREAIGTEWGRTSGLAIRGATPVFSRGTVVGVISVSYALNHAFAERIREVSGSHITVFAPDGNTIASTIADIEHGRGTLKVGDVPLARIRAGEEKVIEAMPLHQGQLRVNYAPIPGPTGELVGILGVMVETEEIDQAIGRFSIQILGISLLTFVIFGALSYPFFRKILDPLHRMTEATKAVAFGDYHQRVRVQTGDELEELGKRFNSMADAIAEKMAENERLNDDLKRQILHLKETQEKLVQVEKLSALGEVIAGVAHELNNPLTTIVGFGELLLEQKCDPQVRNYLEKMSQQAKRCVAIVNNLLTFSRAHKPSKEYVDVNEIVERVIDMKDYQFAVENIMVIKDLDPSLPRTMADPDQIQQVFLNLVNNAQQAMTASKGKGTLTLVSRRSDDRIIVRVTDTGPGIPEDVNRRIFEPFFTTKEPGKGTGLGLSISYGVIKEHGGDLFFERGKGGGVTFVVTLPVVTPAGADAQGPVDAGRREKEIVLGKRVLVVDDEEMILKLCYHVLMTEGLVVDTAGSGRVALEKAIDHSYDLVITDMKMPHMDGREFYRRLCEARPSLSRRVIFFTGDTVSPETVAFIENSGATPLYKPFPVSELRRAVHEVLKKTSEGSL